MRPSHLTEGRSTYTIPTTSVQPIKTYLKVGTEIVHLYLLSMKYHRTRIMNLLEKHWICSPLQVYVDNLVQICSLHATLGIIPAKSVQCMQLMV